MRVKICCFCERWESGGIESFLFNVIQRVDSGRLQVDVVTACLSQSVFTQPLQRMGIRFFELSGDQRNLVQNHRMFLRLLKEQQYDVVHLNLFHGVSLAYAALAKQAGVPIRIAHSHNTALRKSALRPLKQLIHHFAKRAFASCATDFWACSTMAAEFLFPKTELEQKGFQFIPNGIETERFRFNSTVRAQVRSELGLEEAFVIGNVGRLCDQKNQDFLLDIFVQVKSRRPESRLLLVGGGESAEKLKDKVRRLNISAAVIFCGVASHVESFLCAMDVFVMPSRFEGLPVAAIEAQACGLPCIFSNAITQECSIVETNTFLPIETGAWKWASAILTQRTANERQIAGDYVNKSGFSVNSVAKMIEKYYLTAGAEIQEGSENAGRE